MKKLTIAALVLLLVLFALGYFLLRGEPRVLSGVKDSEIYSGEVVVKMTEDGFEPEVTRIRKGSKVIFVNEDKIGHWPASDLHPSHSLYPGFDPKRLIRPGEGWSFTFEKVGEWGMHDHLAPYVVGSIIVTE